MLRREPPARLLDRDPEVIAVVPLERADLRQEVLHLRLVGEQLPVQVAGIPVQQHAADVKHDGVDRSVNMRVVA